MGHNSGGVRIVRRKPADLRISIKDAWVDMIPIWTQANIDQPPEIAPALTLRGSYTLATSRRF